MEGGSGREEVVGGGSEREVSDLVLSQTKETTFSSLDQKVISHLYLGSEMGKWNVLVVMIMMVTTVMVVTVESDNATDWMRCFRSCSVPCEDHNGNCFECCKIKCGGPNPPHGPGGPPAHSFRRNSYGMAYVDVCKKKK
ncbi:unnamed protein product [Brassica oleracea]|nr:unnamed protein product [Brassica napus]